MFATKNHPIRAIRVDCECVHILGISVVKCGLVFPANASIESSGTSSKEVPQ